MRISRWWLVGGLVAGVLGLLGGCSTVAVFDAVVPKDEGSVLAAGGIAYGPDRADKLDIYVPRPAPAAAPVIVFMYGGAWNSGSRTNYSFAGRAFAARGFVTVVPDTRLVPRVRFPAFVEDEARALRFVHDRIAEFGGDPRRIFLVGHSSGAYNAVMLALDPHYLREAGLAPHAIRAVAALSGPYDFLPLDVDASKEAFAGAADLRATQPVNLATRSAPPMFLATGSADTFVHPRNTYALARALDRAGAEIEVKTYPGLSHSGTVAALSRPFRGGAPVLEDVVAFLSRHL
jgi:acetyl esterase/lipase